MQANRLCSIILSCGMLAFVLLRSTPAHAEAAFYVATTGNDAHPGTFARPWRTIQKAANIVGPGSTVYVRGGIYHERVTIRVSGSASGGYITFRNYQDEKPIVDGTGLTVPASETGLFLIVDRHHVVIRGFDIRNYKTTAADRVPVGIRVAGASHHLKLLYNTIHHIEHNRVARHGVDAHGIAVYGDDPVHAIHNLTIHGNELYALKLGSSEALVVNGNVDGFRITNNVVHHNNNIGIDAIGFEGVSADPATDQARHGVIAQNLVYRIDSSNNPAYAGERSAAGIYVDGGRNITIERNIVHHNNIGIELASEHAGRATRQVTVRNNFIYFNDIVGMTIGGFDTRRGSTQDCTIVNNTLLRNDTLHDGNGELLLQYDTRNNVIKNNILYANSQNYLITNPFTQNVGNVVDSNLFFVPGGATNGEWQWQKVWYTGFAAYRAGTGNDARTLFVNPALVSLSSSAPNLHLRASSPAIDAGQNLNAAGTVDIDGQQRIMQVIDIGADEVR